MGTVKEVESDRRLTMIGKGRRASVWLDRGGAAACVGETSDSAFGDPEAELENGSVDFSTRHQ